MSRFYTPWNSMHDGMKQRVARVCLRQLRLVLHYVCISYFQFFVPMRHFVSCIHSLLRPMSHLQFYRAILSRNFIARQNRKCDTCNFSTGAQLLFRLEQPLVRVSVFGSLDCFDTDGWVARRTPGPHKTNSTNRLQGQFSSGTGGGGPRATGYAKFT